MGSRLFAIAALLLLAAINWQLYLQGREMQSIHANITSVQTRLDDIEDEISNAPADDGSEDPSGQPMNNETGSAPGKPI